MSVQLWPVVASCLFTVPTLFLSNLMALFHSALGSREEFITFAIDAK